MKHRVATSFAVTATALLLTAACAEQTPANDGEAAGDLADGQQQGAATGIAAQGEGVRTGGDWQSIQAHGSIRLAHRSWEGFDTMPQQGLSAERYRHLATQFAERYQLDVVWLAAADMRELLAAVEGGTADIAVANITVTSERQERFAFSLPLTRSREWVVGVDDDGVFGVADHTTYAETLARHYPNARRTAVPADADPSTLLALIEDGMVDATIMDEAVARVIVDTSPKIDKLRELPEAKDHAWALRRDAKALKATLDAFLRERHVVDDRANEVRDWPAIVEAKRLRMLTTNTPTTYYLWRGELLGYEYELVNAFAKAHDLALEVVVARELGELFEWLAAGRGDLIAAGLTPTAARADDGLRFTQRYHVVRETVVTAGTPIVDLAGLAGRRLTINPHTTYAATLDDLRVKASFDVDYLTRTTEALLDEVAEGNLDATLADSHRAELAATFHSNLSLGLAFEPRELAWAVRAENEALLNRLDDFVRQGYRSYDFNVLRNKYFVNQRRMSQQRQHRVTGEALSPYDGIVKPLAAEVGIDWRLIVAQMYQESGFDPSRVSFAGARGLLQVLPRTAREVGIDPDRLHEPGIGISAGVRYLDWTRDRFPDLPVGEQLLFALASYNAGAGHVRDGRRLAIRLGLNGSLWFDNVERTMLKLAEPEYARQAVHGYVRGTEVVRYVREIHDRYRAYLDHFRLLDSAAADG